MPEPEYSVQGYAFATMAYAMAHKIPMPQKNSIFCGIEYGI